MTHKTKIIISLALIAIGIGGRLLPHVWNFTPVVAIALFAGVYLGRPYALVLPIITMFASDIFIGFYEWKLMLAVYISFVLAGILGILIKKYKSFETVLAGSITVSVLFFLIANWAVWQFTSWYPSSFEGLIQSYIMALPFFRNTLAGNIFYTLAIFGAYEGAFIWVRYRKAPCVSKNKSLGVG